MALAFSDFGIELPRHGSGKNVYTLCPQCSDSRKKRRDKCLSVNTMDGLWNCHHCGWKGSLAMEKEKKPVIPAKRTEPIKVIPFAASAIDPSGLQYLQERGIDRDVVERNGITTAIRSFGGAKEGCLSFPYRVDGQVVNVKYRTRDKKFSQEAGASKVVYGYDDISDDVTFIVEGEIDKLSFEMAGIENCISVPDGAPSPTAENFDAKFDFLETCADRLSTVKKFVIAVDSDAPGQKLASELSRRLGRYRCAKLTWPEDCKDANDTLLKHGIAKIAECVYQAKDYPIEGLLSLTVNDMLDFYDTGIQPGVHPGWNKLAEYYTVRPGEFTVVTAAPNSGKSEFIDALMVNLADRHGWKFAVFSPENAPIQMHVNKLVEKVVGKTARENHGNRASREEYREAAQWVLKHFHFLSPESGNFRLDEILNIAQWLLYRHGINGLLIDPWNELDHEFGRDTTETQYVSKCLSKLRTFARQNDIHTWIVAHPSKLQKVKNDDGDWVYPPATPYEISGSAHWFNKADVCLCVHRPDGEGVDMDLYIQKMRFKTTGKKGKVGFLYNVVNGRYTERMYS